MKERIFHAVRILVLKFDQVFVSRGWAQLFDPQEKEVPIRCQYLGWHYQMKIRNINRWDFKRSVDLCAKVKLQIIKKNKYCIRTWKSKNDKILKNTVDFSYIYQTCSYRLAAVWPRHTCYTAGEMRLPSSAANSHSFTENFQFYRDLFKNILLNIGQV